MRCPETTARESPWGGWLLILVASSHLSLHPTSSVLLVQRGLETFRRQHGDTSGTGGLNYFLLQENNGTVVFNTLSLKRMLEESKTSRRKMIYAQTENLKGGGAGARTAVGQQGAVLPHCLGCPQLLRLTQ